MTQNALYILYNVSYTSINAYHIVYYIQISKTFPNISFLYQIHHFTLLKVTETIKENYVN